MKKMNLTRKLMAACSIVALSAVMYGCVHSGDDPEPMVEMPEPVPEPMEPAGPTDLQETQTAAADAADAAADSHQCSRRFSINVATHSHKVATPSYDGGHSGAKRRDHVVVGSSPSAISSSAIPPPKALSQAGGAWCARDA